MVMAKTLINEAQHCPCAYAMLYGKCVDAVHGSVLVIKCCPTTQLKGQLEIKSIMMHGCWQPPTGPEA